MELLSLIFSTSGNANMVIGGILVIMGLWATVQAFRIIGRIFK
jgi:hypothetical protein